MARFKANEASNYGGQGGGGFFSIAKNNGVKRVRFMYNTIDDMEGLSVHKVKVKGKERYVNCLRDYNSPKDDCPFCRENKPVQAKLFIPIYNIDEDQVQIWDRGKTFFEKMTSQFSRYGTKKNMVQNIFEIERHGEPKDMNTTYEIFQVESDDTQIEDLPELPDIVGSPKSFVLDKTADDMEYYLEAGEFPPEDEDEEPRTRESRQERASEETSRRTPANTNGVRRRGDAF